MNNQPKVKAFQCLGIKVNPECEGIVGEDSYQGLLEISHIDYQTSRAKTTNLLGRFCNKCAIASGLDIVNHEST